MPSYLRRATEHAQLATRKGRFLGSEGESGAPRWEVRYDQPRGWAVGERVVKLPLDPETALRALLAVDPDDDESAESTESKRPSP